jgi:hypothetical protein
MVGVYPVGTLVRLNTGEIGLIHQGTAVEEGRLPRILLIKKTGKKQFAADRVVDLNELDSATGRPRRWVRSTHNPYHYGIQPAIFLMQA